MRAWGEAEGVHWLGVQDGVTHMPCLVFLLQAALVVLSLYNLETWTRS